MKPTRQTWRPVSKDQYQKVFQYLLKLEIDHALPVTGHNRMIWINHVAVLDKRDGYKVFC